MPSLLFLTQRIPYPPTKGEKIRALQILRHLAGHYDVHLGCLVDDPDDVQYMPAVAALCSTSHFAPLDRRRAKLKCLRGLLTGEPLSVTFYRDPALARWVQDTIRDAKPAAVFVCSSNMAPYILDLRGQVPTCLVDLVDVDSEKWRAYAETGRGIMRWVHAREWRRTAALEARIARECDWSTFVSAQELQLFQALHPGHAERSRAISNGVDHVYFDSALPFGTPFAPGGTDFVFTGVMDYPPNEDAVIWFAEAILPLIRRAIPDAHFHIVGSSPSPRVAALAAEPGVTVTGRVPDVRPFLAHAAACVAPMRIARGIQNKVLEAMAMARPTVVTPEALEGIDATPGTEVLTASTASAFAQACIRAVSSTAAGLGPAARARVLRDYVWAERLRGFDPLLGLTHAPQAEPARMPEAAAAS